MRNAASVLLVLALLGSGSGLGAVPADVTYVNGEATLRRASGRLADASIGDTLDSGDGLATGADGTVELDRAGVIVRIAPGTVFTLMERSEGGAAAPVVSVVLGSVKLRYSRLTGKEPSIRTASSAAGVRGTELTVYAGADGSSLFVVDSGVVTVEAEGRSVELGPSEAVEVPLGRPPGEKTRVERDQIDFRAWSEGKLAALLADPLASMASVRARLASYIESVESWDRLYREAKAQLDGERAKRVALAKDKGAEEAAKYEKDIVEPLALETRARFLNLRYNALAALSLRRYVAGRLYVMLKPRELVSPNDPLVRAFRAEFAVMLEAFERSITPRLVDADI